MLVKDLMTIYPICLPSDTNIRHAAEIFSLTEVSEIMVVDEEQNFIGVLSEGDLLRALMPDFEEILGAGGTLYHAFELFIQKGSLLAEDSIAHLIIHNPIMVKTSDEVAKIATIMIQKNIRRLPVVENNKLVGTISRSDLCRAIIFNARRGGKQIVEDGPIPASL